MEAGTIIRAYIARCVVCHGEEILKDDNSGYMTKAVMEWSLRKFSGWSKTKNGWKCNYCLTRK